MTTLGSTQQKSILEQMAATSLKWLSAFGLVAAIYALLHLLFSTPDVSLALVGSEKLAWYLSRSSGTVAYILLTASMGWGLLLSTKLVKALIPGPLAFAMHNVLSWTAIGLSLFHAAILLFDKYYTYTLVNLLIPFTGPYQPEWVGLGIIGLYLMGLTAASFSWQKWLGHKTWRRLHYLTFGAYLLVTAHGLMAGTDSGNPGMLLIFSGSGLLVFFLTIYRILTSAK